MKIKIKTLVIILIITLIMATLSSTAMAYRILQGEDSTGTIVYCGGLANSYISFQSWNGFSQETRWAIDYASRQWNNRTGQTKLYHSATQHSFNNKSYECDNQNLITKVSLAGTELASVLMHARSWHVIRSDGKMYTIECDIVVNADKPRRNDGGTSGYDVQNVMTHEFGHMLGLDDVSADSSVTMYYSAGKGETKKRTLEQDDINGFNYLY